MRRSSKSTLVFLIAWLTAMMSGYLASRHRIFAIGVNPGPCVACQFCEQVSQISTGIGEIGYTAKGFRTPWAETALNGTQSGGANDIYRLQCNNAGTASEVDPPESLTIWNIIGGQNACAPAKPAPAGNYEMENCTISSALGTLNLSVCVNTD